MKGQLKERYHFVDISVLMRTDEGEYVNLTDYSVTEENEKIRISANERFVLMFCTFLKRDRYAAGITVDEMLTLANIKSRKFIDQIHSGLDHESYEQLTAILCAKKVMDYAYGKSICRKHDTENDTYIYDFMRKKVVNDKRVFYPVLTKQFRRV